MKPSVVLSLLFVLTIGLMPVLADGGMERPLTEQEKTFFQSAYQAGVGFLPPAPAGWNKDVEEISIPSRLSQGVEPPPLPMTIRCEYAKPMDQSKAFDMANNAGSMEALGETVNKLSEQLQAAAAKGDQKEMARLQEEMQKAVTGNAGVQKAQAIAKENELNNAHISIDFNANGADYSQVKEIPAPAPAFGAIRMDQSTNPQLSGNGTTWVFLGPFSKKGSGDSFQIYTTSKSGKGTDITRIIIQIRADGKVADDLLAKMDLKGLAGLIKQ